MTRHSMVRTWCKVVEFGGTCKVNGDYCPKASQLSSIAQESKATLGYKQCVITDLKCKAQTRSSEYSSFTLIIHEKLWFLRVQIVDVALSKLLNLKFARPSYNFNNHVNHRSSCAVQTIITKGQESLEEEYRCHRGGVWSRVR